MNIFSEVKAHLTARQVAESYGLYVRRNGTACCPFHDDRHPSMKVDKNYHCFACGASGDAIDYTARMYGLSQYDAAKKLIEDFNLPIHTETISKKEKERLHREKEERMRIIRIKKRFSRWRRKTVDLLKEALVQIDDSGQVFCAKAPDVMFSDDYAMMLHAEPIINFWLDILCMGSEQEQKELFIQEKVRGWYHLPISSKINLEYMQGPDCFLCRKPESLRAISLFLKEQTVVMRSGCSVL